MKGWVVWVPRQKWYLLDEAMPHIVTSYEWHARHFFNLEEAQMIARVIKGEVRDGE